MNQRDAGPRRLTVENYAQQSRGMTQSVSHSSPLLRGQRAKLCELCLKIIGPQAEYDPFASSRRLASVTLDPGG